MQRIDMPHHRHHPRKQGRTVVLRRGTHSTASLARRLGLDLDETRELLAWASRQRGSLVSRRGRRWRVEEEMRVTVREKTYEHRTHRPRQPYPRRSSRP